MYVLPTVHISIGLEGNLAEACDVDGLRLQQVPVRPTTSITLTLYLLHTCTCNLYSLVSSLRHTLRLFTATCQQGGGTNLVSGQFGERIRPWDLDVGNSSETRGC